MAELEMISGGNTDLRGITSLMNPDALKPNVDLLDIEKNMIGTDEQYQDEESDNEMENPDDPIAIYSRDINLLKHELGIELDEKPPKGNGSSFSAPKKPPRRQDNPSIADLVAELDLKIDMDSIQPGRKSDRRRGGSAPADDSDASAASRHSRRSTHSRRSAGVDPPQPSPRNRRFEAQRSADIARLREQDRDRRMTRPATATDRRPSGGRAPVYTPPSSYQPAPRLYDPQMAEKNRYLAAREREFEQGGQEAMQSGSEPGYSRERPTVVLPPDSKYAYRGEAAVLKPLNSRRPDEMPNEDPDDINAHINSVMNGFTQETKNAYSAIERQNERTLKQEKIEEIRQLKMTLEEENVNCDAILVPTEEDAMANIDSTLYTLQLKMDRTHYSTMAEGIVTGFVETFVEGIFDGKRTFPLIGAPDYTDYHKTVSMKMYRMRHQTSQVVGKIIQKYNIGPTARILLELVPSIFTYPKERRKRTQSRSGLSDDPTFNDNIRKIRTSDFENDVKTLEEYE